MNEPVYFFHKWVHVYLLNGQNGSFCNSICRCLMFLHVYYFSCLSTKFADWYFVYLFSQSVYFVLLHYRQKINVFFLSTLSLSTFFTDKKFVYFLHSKIVSFCSSICRYLTFSMCFFIHVCLLFSRPGTLSSYCH